MPDHSCGAEAGAELAGDRHDGDPGARGAAGLRQLSRAVQRLRPPATGHGLATLQPLPAGRDPRGLWVDLGSGTGRLADALEQQHPGASVLRLDGGDAMLGRQTGPGATLLHDLNQDLPLWPSAPTLLCSSFVLHWLDDPPERLHHWYSHWLPVAGWRWPFPWPGVLNSGSRPLNGPGLPAQPCPSQARVTAGGSTRSFGALATRPAVQPPRAPPVDLLRPMIRTGADSTRRPGWVPGPGDGCFANGPSPTTRP